MASVLDRVRDIAADKLSVDAADVSAESSFTEDLNADSLDVVELIMAIEEEFGSDDTPLEMRIVLARATCPARLVDPDSHRSPPAGTRILLEREAISFSKWAD